MTGAAWLALLCFIGAGVAGGLAWWTARKHREERAKYYAAWCRQWAHRR